MSPVFHMSSAAPNPALSNSWPNAVEPFFTMGTTVRNSPPRNDPVNVYEIVIRNRFIVYQHQ